MNGLSRLLVFGLLTAALLGCPPPTTTGDGGAGGGAGGGDPDSGVPDLAASATAAVRFKRNVRLTTDLSVALGLPLDGVCKELGLYSCTFVVHPLALGGVDPYESGLYEPLPFTGVTSPIVVDRVALAGCTQRVAADRANAATSLIYGKIAVDPAGKLNPAAPEVAAALDTLYKRALLRPPTDAEVGHLTQLYRDIEATGKPDPAQSWMTLSCFAVLTSVESVFY